MQGLTKISVAVVCALGVTAAIAQTVQPRTQGATPARPPIQLAQTVFPFGGGAATGASTAAAGGAAAAGAAAAGAVTFVTFGVVAVAGASESSSGTVTHTP
jgi:hypothetical protein